MDSETLRTFVFDYIRSHMKHNRQQPMQWLYVYQSVSNMAKQRFPNEQYPYDKLTDEDAARLKHVIWDLIIERILIPGTADPQPGDNGWPFLSLTDHGRKVIEAQTPVPYDPDGYIAALKSSVPTVSVTVVVYLAEAVATFRTGNFLASAVMLGAASEMVFNELTQALPPVMADATKRDKCAEKMQRGKMKDRIDAVVGWCRNHASSLPGTWSGDEQVGDIEKIADLIRRRRNEAGHPQDPPLRPTREQMYSYLVFFPEYCRHLYVLKDWALANVAAIK
jgi:hypothetical protein